MTSLAISCERCSFFLNDPGTDELYTRVAQGIRRQETVRLLNNEGIAGAAFLTGQSIIVDDAYADPRFNAAIDRETGYVTKTVLCVPIRTGKGEVIGVAQALNKVGGLFQQERSDASRGYCGPVRAGAAKLADGRANAEGARPGIGVSGHRRRHHLADRSRSAAAAGDDRGKADVGGGALDAVPP